jgi:hypothetical protein
MDKAMALYKKACDAGSFLDCYNLGHALRGGQLFTRDPKQGAIRLKQGCDGGIAPSCYELGLMHEVGDGVARDPGRAAALFTQGCTGGEPRACAKAKAYGR